MIFLAPVTCRDARVAVFWQDSERCTVNKVYLLIAPM